MAIVAHPDDIEFGCAGTLLRLREAGYAIHYMTVASGNCGSVAQDGAATRALREAESRAAAGVLDATWHPPLCDDLEIVYSVPLLRRLGAVVRQVKPRIVLTHSPEDYMEDHMATSRLAVTAAFSRGMPNFATEPAREPFDGEVFVYHAMPHGLCNQLRQPVRPEIFVDTTAVHARKRAALAAHESQREWLDVSQGMDSYLTSMDEMSRAVGRMSGRFEHAEGWRRHLHYGFSARDEDVLSALLG